MSGKMKEPLEIILEYLVDLLLYKGQEFSYPETVEALNCLIAIMQESKEKQICVLVKVN